jgi:D-serine deaminase-like pyridoxal phosphate-dependent protein
MRVDEKAVARLREEPVDWRFKGVPSSVWGSTVEQVVAGRPGLFAAGFSGPLVVLDRSALEHNLTTMAEWCRSRGVQLAPHGKTTMAPQLFARQLDAGAWGITVANIAQLRVCRAFGIDRVLLANQLVDPAALGDLAAELAADPAFAFSCWVDSERGVAVMDAALRSAGATRPVDVMVELGEHGGRTGCRDDATAELVATAVNRSPVLRLAGVAGYEGALAHDTSAEGLSRVDAYLRRMRRVAERWIRAELFEDTDEIVVTAGGSAFVDQVVDVLGPRWDDSRVQIVVRSGAYITHDDGFYRGISPFTRAGARGPRLRPALRAWAQVSSSPEPGLALLTMGKRDVSFDEGLPEPQLVRTADGSVRDLHGWRITALNDQHAFLRRDQQTGPTPQVGDWIGCGVSHPCTVFDKWQLIPMVDGGDHTIVDLVRTFF